MTKTRAALTLLLLVTACASRTPMNIAQPEFVPSEIVDLGTIVTEDLPERFWGKALLKQFGFTRPNEFDVIPWSIKTPVGDVVGSDAYYTLFNHGGPHVDAPNHMSVGGGIDSYPIHAFIGSVKVFDVRSFKPGRSIPVETFRGSVGAGDVVLIYTGYTAPTTETAVPNVVSLTQEAAEFLARLPVRAFGTDGLGVESPQATDPGRGQTAAERVAPIHSAFLSRGIPIYEQLVNVDRLLGKARMFFVGAPLNIKNGDGMIVRPVVFVY